MEVHQRRRVPFLRRANRRIAPAIGGIPAAPAGLHRQPRIVEAAQQRDLALQRSNAVEAAYRDTQVEMAEPHQVTELESQLSKLPPRTTTQVRIADNAELMRALKFSLNHDHRFLHLGHDGEPDGCGGPDSDRYRHWLLRHRQRDGLL